LQQHAAIGSKYQNLFLHSAFILYYIDMRLLIKSNWKPNLLSRKQSDVSTSKLIRTFTIITCIGKLRLRKK